MTTDFFYFIAKHVGLSLQELDEMSVQMVFDFIDEYVGFHNPKEKSRKGRKATQADFDRF
ncbi:MULTISPECIES: hypothetical protein [Cytobacillus]|uniref:hypothetical protein n=1 Tax=Cytobacillus TaxID=2675230 RepID=UPI000DE9BF58|nr:MULTISPECIES: hypothetical protein [Cytobacillus]